MEEKRIFRYVLADAWENMISQVDVIEKLDGGTVRCLYFETNHVLGKKSNTEVDFFETTISREDINKIKTAMYKHKDIFLYKEVEFPAVLDGVINTFEFVNEKNLVNVITAFNIWAFKEVSDVAIFGTPPYKGTEVVTVYDEISKILMDNGVDEKYLKLD